jgi:hypothetical protein
MIKKNTTLGKIDSDLRSGLLTALINFAETAFSINHVEYFEGKKFIIAFNNNQITSEDSSEPELLISYAILDKEKKVDKHIRKIIYPLLVRVSEQFIAQSNGKNLSEVSQFKYFKTFLDKIFGSDTKNVDQKLRGLFY